MGMARGETMIYAIDFDGTLCELAWPEIGQPKHDVIEYCKQLKADGHKLILNTCREGDMLHKAIAWCMGHGLTFDAHNANLPDRITEYGGDCRKISADYYLDDKNMFLEGVNNG